MLIAYPQPGKPKSLLVCSSFLKGVPLDVPFFLAARKTKWMEGDAVFYGIVGIEALFWEAVAARELGYDWHYLDNAFLDAQRGSHYRIGKNALQSIAPIPDYERAKLQRVLPVAPWRTNGKQILVVEQSAYFMEHVARWPGGIIEWRHYVRTQLGRNTDRIIVCREWRRDKAAQALDFARELARTWLVVTHSSAAACEALLRGVPVIVTDTLSAAHQMSSRFDSIEEPNRYVDRDDWVARLAASQWTLDEMCKGLMYRAVCNW